MEIYGLSVGLMSFCEFGECEMISEVKLNQRAGEQWAKQSAAGRYGDGS